MRRTLALVALALSAAGCGGDAAEPAASASSGYVGRAACVPCHEDEHDAWRGSHHDLAMQMATDETVLGDFHDATFEWNGVTSTFTRRGGRFVVRTEGDDGELHDFEVAYVFGVFPLQQYLVAFPGGRYQVLPLCWDSRGSFDGGQRWFHIYPAERITPGDELFWTGPAQRWNSMCADCHSTRLRQRYDVETGTYDTTWSEIDVSCEACHGPAAEHVAWADARGGRELDEDEDPNDRMGLSVLPRRSRLPPWEIDPETGIARRERRSGDDVEIELCARCHSRRGPLRTDYVHGGALHDTHRLALLEESLYFADGQILDEDYVYGSFVQSKMYASGVGCTDCHDPHTLQLLAPGNELCTRCHLATTYDVAEHHFHEAGTPGAACAACHMPERVYMGVDRRADHSIRIPRPDLTRKIGTPNACIGCHADQAAEWAEEQCATWYGTKVPETEHYGEVLHAGRRRQPGHRSRLTRLVGDAEQPAIVRATAIELLRGAPFDEVVRVVTDSLRDEDSLVRRVAASALGDQALPARMPVKPLLRDPVRGVRVAAARTLVEAMVTMTGDDLAAMESAFDELVVAELAMGDRPEAHVNLGAVFAELGRFDEAEREYRTALRLAPEHGAAYANLSDLYRLMARDSEGEALLAQAVANHPDQAVLHHALGLVRVRLGRSDEAVSSLARAAEMAPEVVRYSYVYGVSLESKGDVPGAIAVLEAAHAKHPTEPRIAQALFTIHRDRNDTVAMIRWVEVLTALLPEDPGWQMLLDELRD